MEAGNDNNAESEVVISVHGTFAARPEDEGHDWWQCNSDFWQRLVRKVPHHIKQVPHESTFHWSGRNSASERRAAARGLLKQLKLLEKAGRGYHLIGHSHGGSVIWDTLLLAARQRAARHNAKHGGDILALPGLLSWTTVGTPYIFSRASLSRIVLAFFSAVITLIAVITLGLSVLSIIGMFDPSLDAEQDRGYEAVTVIVMIVFFYIGLAGTLAGIESNQADRERQTARRILGSSGNRWLGLWHSADEAINGLRVSVALAGEIIPRRHHLYHAFTYPHVAKAFIPLALIVNPIYNWILAPLGDRFVRKRIKNSATGNDRPGTYAREIEKAPLIDTDALPHLPAQIEDALTSAADRATKEAAPRLRNLLGRLSSGLGKGLAAEIQESGLSGRELIHTSYFDNSDIALLIAQHVTNHSRSPEELEIPDDIKQWRQQFDNAVDRLVAEQPTSLAMLWKAIFMLATLVLAMYAVTYLYKNVWPLFFGVE
jgi:hypothetical protein